MQRKKVLYCNADMLFLQNRYLTRIHYSSYMLKQNKMTCFTSNEKATKTCWLSFWKSALLDVQMHKPSQKRRFYTQIRKEIRSTAMPGAWRCKVSARTGLPSVSTQWLGETASLTSNLHYSVVANMYHCLSRSIHEILLLLLRSQLDLWGSPLLGVRFFAYVTVF